MAFDFPTAEEDLLPADAPPLPLAKPPSPRAMLGSITADQGPSTDLYLTPPAREEVAVQPTAQDVAGLYQLPPQPRTTPKRVRVPGRGVINFPGEMTDEDIGIAIRKNFPELAQSTPKAMLNAAGQGAVSAGVAGPLKGAGATAEASGRANSFTFGHILARYAQADPETRKIIRQDIATNPAYPQGHRESLPFHFDDIDAGAPVENYQTPGAAPKPQETALYRAGKAVQDLAERVMPVRPENRQKFLVEVAQGVGSTAGFLPWAMAGGAPLAVVSGLNGAGEAADRAIAAGASPRQVIQSAYAGIVPGLGDALAIDNLLRPITRNPAARGWMAAVAKKALEQAGVEASTEAIQEVLQNAIARGIYKPDQDLTENVAKSGEIGALVGALFGGGAGMGARPRPAAQPAPAAPQPATTGPVAVPSPAPAAAAPPPQLALPPPATVYGPEGEGQFIIPPPTPQEQVAAQVQELKDILAAPERTLAEVQQRQTQEAATAAGLPDVGATVRVILPDVEEEQTLKVGGFSPGPDGRNDVLLTDEAGDPVYDGPWEGLDIRKIEGTGTKADPVRVKEGRDVDAAAQQAAKPTPAQAEAGNYKHGHLKWQGLDIAIETPKGGERTGTDKDGKPWSVTMADHYGRVKRTEGADGDQMDIYMGPQPDAAQVYVIDQIDPETGKFDEHKAMAGFASQQDAIQAYNAAFSDGSAPRRFGAVRPMSVDEFKTWLRSGDTKKALAYTEPQRNKESLPVEASAPEAPAPAAVTEPAAAGAPTTKPPTSAQPKRRRPMPRDYNIAHWLANRGGMYDPGGDLAAMGADAWHRGKPGFGRLIRAGGDAQQSGMAGVARDHRFDADVVASDAVQEGLLPEGAGPRELLDAIGAAIAGQGGRSVEDREEAERRQLAERDTQIAKTTRAIEQLNTGNSWGMRPDEIREAAIMAVDENVDPRDAALETMERYALAYENEEAEYAPDEREFAPLEEPEAPADARADAGDGGARAEDRASPSEPAEEAPRPVSGESAGEGAAKPATERTDQGDQLVIPGAGKISDKELAERRMRGGKRAAKAQQAADEGLFDTGARNQTDLVDMARQPQEASPRKGKVGDMLSAGEVVLTSTGRETTPFPKLAFGTEGKARNTVKRAERWLMENALAEANARGDEFNARQFQANLDKPSQADKDSAELYLFDHDFVQPVPRPITKPLSRPAATYGTENKVFTQDAAERARALLKKKLSGTQLNSGIDPEVMQAGITLAGYHIEAGARKFADFVRAMVADLGEEVRPFLRSWYEGARYYPGFDNAGMSEAKEIDDVLGGGKGLERDRGAGSAADDAGEAPVPARSGEDGGSPGERGEPAGEAGKPADRGSRVPDGGAAPVGEGSDRSVPDGSPAVRGGAADRGGRGRGGDPGSEGLLAERTPEDAVDRAAPGRTDLTDPAARAAAQAAADKVAIKPGIQNIRETLPLLTPAQQDDVLKAETRYEKPNGHGFLLTNGTGTGKTYSGIGVAKRFARQGKTNILMVAPSQGILDAWVAAGKDVGLDISVLDSTRDKGKGIVATTYANLGENDVLADREFDLVIADEAHSLSQNEKGERTAALDRFRAVTNHPRGRFDRARDRLRKDWAPIDQAFAIARQNKTDPSPEMRRRYDEMLTKTSDMAKTFEAEPRSKALFLSATPFAYDKTVDYAEGYLFDYGPDPKRTGYNAPDAYNSFFIRHFGYRMRYNRLTKPDSDVNTEIMEREFHEWLKREGALSGRRLEVDADYDRKFILVDDAIGNRIDKALQFLSEADNNKFRPLLEWIEKRFDYLSRQRLLEAIKAHHAVPLIKKHLEMGRKVVVFHDFNEGGGFNPFAEPPGGLHVGELYQEFIARNPGIEKLDFSGMRSPIATLTKAFPGAMVYNGTVSVKQRRKAKDDFNRDGSAKDIIIIQAQAGQAGISLHDTTGKHQRVLINLGMPTRPTAALQEEGRIYRTGQVSDAIIRYMNTGTNWERWTFARTIAERAGTAENLALGNEARTIKQSFIDAYEASDTYEPSKDDGKGGKELDRANRADLTPFERAKTFYFGQQKVRGRRDQREGTDYYATPEPVGLKMVEFANIRAGEKVLEPSAGHGAIARFFPETATRTLVEPSDSLASRAALAAPGANVLQHRFEDLHKVNKFDAIVMNPPFGVGGSTAMQHLVLAAGHLRNHGRIVALIPTGPAADVRFDRFMDSDAAADLYKVGDIKLPAVTFERAGTKIAARIVILEKQTEAADRNKLQPERQRDYSNAETIKELFDRIENAEMAERVGVPAEAAADEVKEPADPDGTDAGHFVSFGLKETKHSKTGEDLYVATMEKRVDSDTYQGVNAIAKKHGGYYSAFRGKGAIPGFQFKSAEARQKFVEEARSKFALGDVPIGWDSVETGVPARDLKKDPLTAQEQAVFQEAQDLLRRRLDLMGLKDVDLSVVEDIVDGKGNRTGFRGIYNPATNHITVVARVGLGRTMDHEAIHAIKAMGLFTDAEWKALERAAEADTAHMAAIKRRYAKVNLPPAGLVEEAIAEMYADWQAGKSTAGGWLGRAFNKIKRLLQAFKEVFTGKPEYIQVFEKVATGIVGGRERAAAPTGEPKMALTDSRAVRDLAGLPVSPFDRSVSDWLQDRSLRRMDRFKGATKAAGRRLRLEVQDYFLPVKATQQAIEQRTGQPLPEMMDAYLREELYHGRVEKSLEDFDEAHVEPLVQALQDSKVSLEDLDQFLYARHAQERNEKVARINPNQPDGGSGMLTADAQAYLAGLSATRRAELERLAGLVDAITKARLDVLEQGGLLSAAQRQAWQDTYRHYVPLRGFEDPNLAPDDFGEGGLRTGQGFDIRGKESKEALGRGEQNRAADIVATALAQYEEAVIRAEKNRIGQAFLNLVQSTPDSSLWEVNRVSHKRVLDKSTGLVKWVADNLKSTQADNVLAVKKGGTVFYITIKDRSLAEALKNLEGRPSGRRLLEVGLAMAGWITRMRAALVTRFSPEFVVSNAIRDIQEAVVNAQQFNLKGLGRDIAKGTLPAIKGVWGGQQGMATSAWQQAYQEFARAGGKVAMVNLSDVEGQKKAILRRLRLLNNDDPKVRAEKAARELGRLIVNMNDAVENGVRLSTFKALRDRGISADQAASIAKNITVNFNRRGANPWIGALYLFFNASVQGSRTVLSAIRRSRKVQAIVGSMIAMGFAQELLNAWMGGDGDDDPEKDGVPGYDKVGDFVKQKSIVIVNPWAKGKDDLIGLQIPMSRSYAPFYYFGVTLAEIARGKTTPGQGALNVLQSIADAFSPLGTAPDPLVWVVPEVLKPFAEIAVNKNFAGNPIMPPKEKIGGGERPDSERYFRTVNPWARDVARLLNEWTGGDTIKEGGVSVSPETIEHLTQWIGGGAGRFTMDLFTKTPDEVEKLVDGNTAALAQIPFARRFTLAEREWWARTEFYRIRDEARIAYDRIKYLSKNGRQAEADAVAKEYAPYLEVRKLLETSSKALTKGRKAVDQIKLDERLNPAQREKRALELSDDMDIRMRQVIRVFNERKKAKEAAERRPSS